MGPEHNTTMVVLNNMCNVLSDQRKYHEARDSQITHHNGPKTGFEMCFAIGPQHLWKHLWCWWAKHVSNALHKIQPPFLIFDGLFQAASKQRGLLAVRERVIGVDHMSTMATAAGLANNLSAISHDSGPVRNPVCFIKTGVKIIALGL